MLGPSLPAQLSPPPLKINKNKATPRNVFLKIRQKSPARTNPPPKNNRRRPGEGKKKPFKSDFTPLKLNREARSKKLLVTMESGKRSADLDERDAKIRKLTEEFEEYDTENEIDSLTAELEERDRKISKLTADLGECDAKIKERDRKITKLAAEIRRLTALLGDRDVRLRKLTAELAKCDATIRIFTQELGQQNTKIGELTADVGDCNRKLRQHAAELEERDEKIRENEAEIRRLTELLGNQDCVIRKLREELEELKDREADESSEELDEIAEELGERDAKIELGERDARIDELSAEIEKRDRKIDELAAELEEFRAKIRKCIDEHRKEEEKLADVTLDARTAHPRLLLSPDLRSARWDFGPHAPPDGPERFDADPCVLGRQTFAAGRHSWVVDLARGQFCAVGVAKESRRRKGPGAFTPAGGIWAVQRWGFKNRALTDPPVVLDLPRVPKKIRICLDYELGEVAFFDAENQAPVFRFPPAVFAGERLRPWFWVEFGSISLVRPRAAA